MLLFMQKIAIIIPCYNEEKRFDLSSMDVLINQTSSDIYLANDGSSDKTLEIISNFSSQNSDRCFVLNYPKNEGKAQTIFKSCNKILALNNYDFIGYFDADFSTPVSEISRMIDAIEIKNDFFLIGSRILLLNSKIERKIHRHIIGRIIVTLINFNFKLGIYDTQCGAKFFSKSIVQLAFSKPFKTSWLFDVEVFIRLKRLDLLKHGKEFPLLIWKDIDGSKLSFKTAFKILKELYYLKKSY